MTCDCSSSIYSEAVAELVAIGAAVGSNCEGCLKYHFSRAVKLGVSRQDIALAVAMAEGVKAAPAKLVRDLAERLCGPIPTPREAGSPPEGTCCGGGQAPKAGSSCCPSQTQGKE